MKDGFYACSSIPFMPAVVIDQDSTALKELILAPAFILEEYL
ncbi:MAG: hypothetical protein ACI9DK_002162 [Vicingaceae bacterium]